MHTRIDKLSLCRVFCAQLGFFWNSVDTTDLTFFSQKLFFIFYFLLLMSHFYFKLIFLNINHAASPWSAPAITFHSDLQEGVFEKKKKKPHGCFKNSVRLKMAKKNVLLLPFDAK